MSKKRPLVVQSATNQEEEDNDNENDGNADESSKDDCRLLCNECNDKTKMSTKQAATMMSMLHRMGTVISCSFVALAFALHSPSAVHADTASQDAVTEARSRSSGSTVNSSPRRSWWDVQGRLQYLEDTSFTKDDARQMETRIDTKLTAMETRIDTKLTAMEERMDKKSAAFLFVGVVGFLVNRKDSQLAMAEMESRRQEDAKIQREEMNFTRLTSFVTALISFAAVVVSIVALETKK
jgi:hypothetical protein